MNLPKPTGLALAVLTGLALVGAVVLVALGHPVPDFLSLVVVGGVTGVAGATSPDVSALSATLTTLIGRVEAAVGIGAHPSTQPTPQAISAPPQQSAPAYRPDTVVTPSEDALNGSDVHP